MMERVVPANPGAGYRAHREEIDAAIRRVLDSGWYILGAEVEALEVEFSAGVGVGYGVGVASGTDALVLALRACGVGPGDEVVTVSLTASATAAAVVLAGAAPVFVDVEAHTFTMDPQRLEDAVTPRTRAVVPVHLYGHPAAMGDILEVARRHRLRVVEDCAQAHGAALEGQRAGAWGDAAAFSFYPTKNLGALGDAGMVVADDASFADRVRLLGQYGWRERYVSDEPGMNSRMDAVQAAVLRVKLRYLDAANRARRRVAGQYTRALTGLGLELPSEAPGAYHVYHQYVVRSGRREELRAFLAAREVGTSVLYPVPVHEQPAYAGCRRGPGGLDRTVRIAREVLCLPMYPELPDAHVGAVVGAVRAFAGRGEGEA